MNILILTSIYPNANSAKGTTPVVHYFCQEWIKQGHKVIVIHNDNRYLYLFYLLPDFIKKYIGSRFGVVLPNLDIRKDEVFEIDNVKILRISMLKILPYGKFSKSLLKNQIKKINYFLDQEDFKPDIISGHWENPQIDLIFDLKMKYSNVKTSLVLHVIKYLNDAALRNKIMSFDSLGFRNITLQNKYVELYKVNKTGMYICSSGLLEHFYDGINKNAIERKFNDNVLSIAYVGSLIKRKNPESVIKALLKINDKINWIAHFIGEGYELNKLKNLVYMYKFENRVIFHGRVNNDKVKKTLEIIQVFVMISSDEAFGLVYLEAMACGCIVVASLDGGFDGIIKEGFNGFLCKPGDDYELAQILLKIDKLTLEEKKVISKNAIETSIFFSNENMSKEYLKNIMN